MKFDELKNVKTKADLLGLRVSAIGHIENIERSQASSEPWLTSIAYSVMMMLEDLVEAVDERLSKIDEGEMVLQCRAAVQMALDFLFESVEGGGEIE